VSEEERKEQSVDEKVMITVKIKPVPSDERIISENGGAPWGSQSE